MRGEAGSAFGVALGPYLYVNKYGIHVSNNSKVEQLGTTPRHRKWP
jgi:hypothetical protein